MKVQDVLLKAMAKKITWWAAAEIIGVTDRTMRRWRQRLEEQGYSGLADGRKGKMSFRRVPLKTVEEVLGLYQQKYYDLNVRHFHEKLREEHGIELSYTWVYQALLGAGLVQKGGGEQRIGVGGKGGRWWACCCTSMAASIHGSAMTDGMTCW